MNTQTDQVSLWAMQCRFADNLLNPLRFIHDDHLPDIGLAGDQTRLLSAQPAFAKGLNLVLSRRLGFDKLKPSSLFSPTEERPEGARLAAFIATLDPESFADLLRLCAIARLHIKIANVLLKVHRQRLEAVFGEGVFDIAIREVSFFYRTLGDEAEDHAHAFSQICAGEETEAFHAMMVVGAAMLLTFVKTTEPTIIPLFTLRFSKEDSDNLKTQSGVMSPEQCHQFKQFLRRRLPQCQAYIG